jgi:hypothetical protein
MEAALRPGPNNSQLLISGKLALLVISRDESQFVGEDSSFNARIVIEIPIDCCPTSYVELSEDPRQMNRHIGHPTTGKDWKTANSEKNMFP